MRAHLIECLEKKQFMMFPIRKARWQGSKIKSSEIVPFTVFAYARNKTGINDTVQPLQTMVPWKTLCKDT